MPLIFESDSFEGLFLANSAVADGLDLWRQTDYQSLRSLGELQVIGQFNRDNSYKMVYETKEYPSSIFIKSPQHDAASTETERLLRRRKTVRIFSGKPLSSEDLFFLLTNTQSVINGRMPVPSAGGRFPLEIYVVNLTIQNLPKGLFHWNWRKQGLELLKQQQQGCDLAPLFCSALPENLSCLLFITATSTRTLVKYRRRGWRLMAFEVGHIMHHLWLLATLRNLGFVPLSGGFDQSIHRFLEVDPLYEIFMIAGGLGHPSLVKSD